MTTLLLVRHGETEWNRAKRMQGRTDIDLSERGAVAVARLAPLVNRWKPRTAIVSPLRRARSTAALLTPLEALVDERWTEHGLGDWEGRTPVSIGADYRRWRAGEMVPPGGESRDDIGRRVDSAVSGASSYPGPVLIVTHGGTIRAVLERFVGLVPRRIRPVSAASLTVLEIGEEPGDTALRQFNVVG